MIIDTHAHIYSEDETRYPMIPEPLRPPAGSGTPEHLSREMAASGVTHVIAIQTSTAYRWDNRLIADTTHAAPPEWTGVCTLDPLDATSPAQLATLVRESRVRGLRSVTAATDPPALDHPGVAALWQAARELGIVVNALVSRRHAAELARLLERFPTLPVVLDHCFNPKAQDGPDSPLVRTVCGLARFPNLHAKLTFIPTGSATGFPCADMHATARAILDAFGPDRCVWGSDFPCELWCPNVSYAEHLRIFTEALPLSPGERDAILAETPRKLWFAVRE
jgi:predicted TIM-barrel fold metal-dependent hydrolase